MNKFFSSHKKRKILSGLKKLTLRAGSLYLAAAMIFTGIPLYAQEKDPAEPVLECPFKTHEHDESCYEKICICENTEADHVHDENCYQEQQICGLADFAVHTHQPDYCYDKEGNLICQLPEIKEHIHGPECYQTTNELNCGLEEGKDHTHDASCYSPVSRLICDKEETRLHTHNESCYNQAGERICGLDQIEAHEHDKSCMKQEEQAQSEEDSDKKDPEEQKESSDSEAEPEEDKEDEGSEKGETNSTEENREGTDTEESSSAVDSAQPADETDYAGLTEKAELRAEASPYKTSLFAQKDGEVRIDKFDIRLLSGAAPDAAGTMAIWTPSSASSGHSFVYRADYAISGTYDMGGIQITLPLHIIKDRDGNWADQFDCPYLTADSAPADADFVYETNPENNTVTIYSRKKVSAGLQGYIEFSYMTTKPTTSYVDMELSAPVQASISGKGTDQDSATVEASGIPVAINTSVSAAYTQKQANPVYYSTWQDAWGTAPDDADKFYYLVWTVHTVMNSATSPYTIELDDPFDALGGNTVGYRFAGTQGYSESGTSEPLQTSSDRYDYVLVRYSKEQADALIKEKNRYDISNRINVTVTPSDGKDPISSVSGSASWSFSAPVYVVPTGNFWAHKSGVYGNGQTVNSSANISSYDLSSLMENQTPIEGLQYSEYVESYPYPWTAEGELTGTEADADKYGKKNVDYLLEDRTLLLEKTALQPADYDISSVRWKVTMRDAVYSSDLKQFVPAPIQYTDNDQIVFEVYDEEGTARTAAIYDMKSRSYTQVDNSLVISAQGQTLALTEGVKGFAMRTSNAHYYTRLSADPDVTLYPTEHVTEDILGNIYDPEQYTKAELTNQMTGTLFQDNSILKTKSVSASDFIQASVRTGTMSKTMTGASNDKIARQYRVSWKASMSEMVQDQNGTSPVEQSGGTFYDLLPAGAILDSSSISVYDGNTEIDSGSYTVSVTENYKNSGRTMVKIAVSQPAAQGYSVQLSTLHSWNALQDYGKVLLNSAAYETDNANIGSGSADDGGKLIEKDLMSGLDPEAGDAKKFLYAQSTYTVSLLMASQTGLMKQVRGENDSAYSESSFISNNGTYSYLLRTSNDASTRTTDIIFFDSLENDHKPDGTSKISDWHGTLQGIDTSQIVRMGADPKIYISMKEDLNINDHHDLNDTDVWQLFTDQDLTEVKAVAVDASKTPEGSDFILPAGESLTLILFMKAPAEDPGNAEDPTAFNNVYAQSRIVSGDPAVPGEAALYNQGSTQIHFRTAADVPFRKVSTQDESEPVKGAVYELSGISSYGSGVSERKTTNAQGEITFDTVEKGTYTLREVSTTPDWLLDTDLYKVTVNADATVSVNGVQTDGAYLLRDRPRVHADLRFDKVNSITGASVEGAKFKLSGTSDYGNNVLVYASSNSTGSVEFNNIEQGTYSLSETAAPDGYVPSQMEWQFTVNEMGQVQLFEKSTDGMKPVTQPESGGYLISNEPLHTISFVKSSTYGTGIYLEGAEFHLYGISDLGTQVDLKAVSQSPNNFGMVTFTGLEPGVYSLQETKAPTDKNNTKYILDDTIRTVRVLTDGSFTISGLSTASINDVQMQDWRNSPEAGTVTINKEWQDDLTDEQRNQIENIPDITITTSPPFENPNGYTLSFDANGGQFSDGSSTRSLVYTPAGSLLTGQKYEIPSMNGADFGGWKDSNGQIIEFDTNGNCITPISSDMKLTAIWNEPILLEGPSFNKAIPDSARTIIFTRGGIPSGLEVQKFNSQPASDTGLLDVTAEQNGLVVAWMDGTTMYVSTTSPSMTSIFNRRATSMFANKKMESIQFDAVDTSRTELMYGMFQAARNLTALDLKNFDTSNVTNMEYMFDMYQGGTQLKSIDVSSFDTSKVTTMRSMFRYNTELTSLDVTGFNTSSCENMGAMFENMPKVTQLDVSNFDTSNVYQMGWMFNKDSGLSSLDLSGFNTEKVQYMNYMFGECTGLTSLDLRSFHTPSLRDGQFKAVENMFLHCENLETLDMSNFTTANVQSFRSMFDSCFKLKNLNISSLTTQSATSTRAMFSACRSMPGYDLSKFTTDKVTDMAYMFYNNKSLTSLDLSMFDTARVKTMNNMFDSCSSLSQLNLSSFNTGAVTNMSNMFNRCSSLSELDLSNFNTGSVTDMSSMFSGMSNLTSLSVSNFNVSKVVYFKNMFSGCSSLQSLDLSSFVPNAAGSGQMQYMFASCPQLTTIYATDWNSVIKPAAGFNGGQVFQGDTNLTGKSADGQVTRFDPAKTEAGMCTPNGGYFTDPVWKQ